MDSLTMIHVCTICGREKTRRARWLLVAENRWEDKLKILQWDDRLAAKNGIHQACSAAHVRELVVHWMSTGSLCYPYSKTESFWDRLAQRSDLDISGAKQLGELCVHRESIRRVLHENPNSLTAILDELVLALRPQSDLNEDVEAAVVTSGFTSRRA